MPAQLRRRRLWSVGIAVLAIILGGAVVGPHSASWRSAPARAWVTSVHVSSHGSARAVDLQADSGHPAVAPHTDLTTPPEPSTPMAAAARPTASPVDLIGAASPTTSEHSGRAPPQA